MIMEKYFIVTEKSKLHKDYMEYKRNTKEVNDHVNEFLNAHGIETDLYAVNGETLYIQPTQNDIAKFGKSLGKPIQQDLQPFKKNSAIAKEWVKSLDGRQMKIKQKPYVPLYFKGIYGSIRSRIFAVNEIVYISIDCQQEVEPIDEFVEIKASEFYKVIEENS